MPRQDYLLVRPLERKASAVIEVVLRERPNLGQVVAVGPGKSIKDARGNPTGRVRPLDVKVGDVVRFGEFKDMFPEYWEGNQRYLILQEADIAGVVEGGLDLEAYRMAEAA